MQPEAPGHEWQERRSDTVLSAFITRKLEIDTMLRLPASLSADHFGVDPDEVYWGHVSTLAATPICCARSATARFGRASTPPDAVAPSASPRAA
jgi:hypothetical protein